ncbi:MAG TPA: hypothetical protein DHV17_01605 [Chitinophagaceae bacterium]|nr:hypothetical protein [Chitinophagaceae bacterium]
MALTGKFNAKRVLVTSGWILLAIGCLVVLLAAVRDKNESVCKSIDVNISGVSNHFFIDKQDVLDLINRYSGEEAIGQAISSFDLVGMESELEKDVWVKNAELYFDSHNVLKADVEEREPVARVFANGTHTFYIDSSLSMLPLSDKFSARVPVFTGFPSDAKVLTKADSALLRDIRNISQRLQEDSFMLALVQQVDITPSRSFEFVPYIGNQVIVLGDAQNLDEKFSKLSLFYRNMMPRFGWNRYSIINLQFKGQVVAKLKGKDDVSADSLRTIQLMQAMAATAEKLASDSVQTIVQDNERNTADSTMIKFMIQREEPTLEPTIYFERIAEPAEPSKKQEEPKATAKPAKKPVAKPAAKPAQKKPGRKN